MTETTLRLTPIRIATCTSCDMLNHPCINLRAVNMPSLISLLILIPPLNLRRSYPPKPYSTLCRHTRSTDQTPSNNCMLVLLMRSYR